MEFTRTSEYVGRNAHFIVPFGIGLGSGAFIAVMAGVASSAVPMTVYLALVTTFVAAGISVVSAWSLAARSDQIKRRRKTYIVRLRLDRLRRALQSFELLIRSGLAAGLTRLDPVAIGSGAGAFMLISAAAKNPPDFEEAMNTQQDFAILIEAERAFHFCAQRFTLPDKLDANDAKVLRDHLLSWLTATMAVETVDKAIADIVAAEAHLAS